MRLEQRTQALNLIWIGMVSSIGCYWVVKHLIAGAVRSLAFPPWFVGLLMFQAVVVYALAAWWSRRLMGMVSRHMSPARLASLTSGERSMLPNHLQTSVIVTLSLLEAPALLGLINSFGTSPFPHLFEWFASISLAGLVLFRVKGYPEIVGLLERLERQAGPPA